MVVMAVMVGVEVAVVSGLTRNESTVMGLLWRKVEMGEYLFIRLTVATTPEGAPGVTLGSNLRPISPETYSLTLAWTVGKEVALPPLQEGLVKFVSLETSVVEGDCGQKQIRPVLVRRIIMAQAVCIIAVRISRVWIMVGAQIPEDAIVTWVMLAIDANTAVSPRKIAVATENVINLASVSVIRVSPETNVSTCARLMVYVSKSYVAVTTVSPASIVKPSVTEMGSASTTVACVTHFGEDHTVNELDALGSPTALETDYVTVRFRNATAIRDGKVKIVGA